MNDPLLSLLDRDGPRLHALLGRLTLRDDVAADLLQELFLRLRDARTFREADDPSAYARRTATNLALEWRRRRRPAVSIDACDPPARPCDPLDAVARTEDVGRVLDAVAALASERSRQCFVMRHLDGASYAAIAAAIGRTEHQARGLCHAAVRQVREQLDVKRIEVCDE